MSISPIESARPYYPEVPNHIANDPTPKDEAVYVPAVQSDYAMNVYNRRLVRPLPAGLSVSQLNFLDPANRDFFSLSHVLSSAGQALDQPRDCIITKRDRSTSTLICDSGGYQIASGRMHVSGVADVVKILRWEEQHGDYGMTLDVPTGPLVRNPASYSYRSFADCLTQTLGYLDTFDRKRTSASLKLLNVLQGNTPAEADEWYDAVKKFDFEGWAFAGLLRNDIPQLLRRILTMADENQLQSKVWIHVLGTSDLETAVLLTGLQRSINRHINPTLRISYDTSSPFRALATKSAYSLPNLTLKGMSMPMRTVPDSHDLIGSQEQWPWPSPVGDRITLGDFCVQRPAASNSYHDQVSHLLLAHHNLSALCAGINLANRVFDGTSITGKHVIAQHVGAAVEAIDRVLESGDPAMIGRYRATFKTLRHTDAYDTGDEHRE